MSAGLAVNFSKKGNQLACTQLNPRAHQAQLSNGLVSSPVHISTYEGLSAELPRTACWRA